MGLLEKLSNIDNDKSISKESIISDVRNKILESSYHLHSMDDTRPWGAFFRLDNQDAERFVQEFFPEVDYQDAKLGRNDVDLSPKILLVSPKQRLSWQYHNRRAEMWAFLTDGEYAESLDDNQELNTVHPGEIVKFNKQERHRLIGGDSLYTIVAEIWQHIDPEQPSDEDDIVRLQDDYYR